MAQPLGQRRDQKLDQIEEAWSLYLATTQYLPLDRYEEVEPLAWRNLCKRLRELRP